MHKLLPVTTVLFAKEGGDTLDGHHAFTVEYQEDGDVSLGFHDDDSEVTLNVCLGDEFVGGDVYFRGQRCQAHVNTISLSKTQAERLISNVVV